MRSNQQLIKHFQALAFLFILATLITAIYLYCRQNFSIYNGKDKITSTEIIQTQLHVSEASVSHQLSEQSDSIDDNQGNRFGLGRAGIVFDNYLFTTFDNDIVKIDLRTKNTDARQFLTLQFWQEFAGPFSEEVVFTAHIPCNNDLDAKDGTFIININGDIIAAQKIITLSENQAELFNSATAYHPSLEQKDSGLYINIFTGGQRYAIYHLATTNSEPMLLSDEIDRSYKITEKEIDNEMTVLLTCEDIDRSHDKDSKWRNSGYIYFPQARKFVTLFRYYDYLGQDDQGNIYARDPQTSDVYQWQVNVFDHAAHANYWLSVPTENENQNSWDSNYKFNNGNVYFLSDDNQIYVSQFQNKETKLLYDFNEFFTDHEYEVDNWYVETIKDGRFGVCLCSLQHIEDNDQNSFYDLNAHEFVENIDDCYGHAHAWMCG